MTRPAAALPGIVAWVSLLLCCGTAVHAGDVDATSRVVAVTVFPRAAEVTRQTQVNLPAGEHTIILRDLPARMLTDSIRVEGEASGTLAVGSVDTRSVLLPEAKSATRERERLEDEIQRLTDQHTALADRIAAAEAQKTLIRNLTKLPEQPGPRDQAQGARSPTDWADISSLIVRQMSEAQKEIRDANVAIRGVQRRTTDLQRELASIPPRRVRRTEVRVNVTAESNLDAMMTVRYQVADASWQPIYEARLATGDGDNAPALELTRRARVSQRTGEAWTDVRLALSSTRPRQGTAAPQINTLRAEFQPKLTSRKYRSESDELAEIMPAPALEPEAAPAGDLKAAAKPVRKRISRTQASVIEAPFQAQYLIPGRHSVPTDGATRNIEIDHLDFSPKLIVRSVPRKRAAAYLYADFALADGRRLLPGTVSLFRDGIFVGRGRLPVLTSGEKHELGFGEDDTVRVEHITLVDKKGESGLISTSKTDTRQFRMTIVNGHKRAVDIRVLDHIPVSGNDDIEVIVTSGTTAPSVRDLDDKKGVFAWDFSLKPQRKQVINFGYRLSWPEGRKIRLRENHKRTGQHRK